MRAMQTLELIHHDKCNDLIISTSLVKDLSYGITSTLDTLSYKPILRVSFTQCDNYSMQEIPLSSKRADENHRVLVHQVLVAYEG